MPKRKRRLAKSKRTLKSTRSRKSGPGQGGAAARRFVRFALPLILSGTIVGALVFMGLSGYRTATASDFFGVKSIDIRGTERTPAEDIRRIVAAQAERSGVWNADLSEIRSKIEKFPFVKTAAVSMVLPAGIRVNVIERVPQAIVHLSSGDFLIDGDAMILSAVTQGEKGFPFVIKGWDETKTEKAATENLARLKLYKKMLDEWRQFDLESRVKEVNLADMKEPKAVIEDSGREISIALAKDNLGKSLKTAIEAVAGKGAKVRSVDAAGIYPVIQFLEF